ncbi:MAG: amidohydrolase [Gemmataceae bacterium]
MKYTLSAVAFVVLGSTFAADGPPDVAKIADRTAAIRAKMAAEYDSLETMYKDLHAHPELSTLEVATGARMAKELKAIGFDVTHGVGGHGVVGLFRNGPGPIVMVRTDLDALPVTEATGVPYASKVRTRDRHGNEVGAMHACGHDLHMTCWVGTARTLVALKDRWSGTLMFVGQPAEETGSGARTMLEDGLFKRFPKPDYALALHCDSRLQAGRLAYSDGLAMANVDSVDILVKGRGGHGSAPHTTIDPIVLAARIVLDLQTIVSRETNPLDPCVVTVGSIHGGTKHNIIPNDVKLQITVRTTKPAVRKHTLEAIERIAKAAALAAKAPEPEVKLDPSEFTPATVNEKALTKRTADVFRHLIGPDNVDERPPLMGGEDFSRYGLAGVPIFMYFLGTIDAERFAAAQKEGAKPLPSMHSDSYWPTPKPSIELGVLSMSQAVLNLVGK